MHTNRGYSSLNERLIVQQIKEGMLEIDADGQVWKLAMKRNARIFPVPRRKIGYLHLGYVRIEAQIDGEKVACFAHRLVWQHLYGDIPEGMEINHINAVKTDNRPCNLELVTRFENREHAKKLGLIWHRNGEHCYNAILTDDQVEEVRKRYAGGEKQTALAREFGVSQTGISRIVLFQNRARRTEPIAS